jgi:hypothetical protein
MTWTTRYGHGCSCAGRRIDLRPGGVIAGERDMVQGTATCGPAFSAADEIQVRDLGTT